MGNSNSHGPNSYATSDTQVIPPHSWAYSFPRSQYFRPPTSASKVLPTHMPGQRLRPTENGSMLHDAGTITGRRPYEPMHQRDEVRSGPKRAVGAIAIARFPVLEYFVARYPLPFGTSFRRVTGFFSVAVI